MFALHALVALASPGRTLVVSQATIAPEAGAPFADPAALRGWLLDDPGGELRVVLRPDATPGALRRLVEALMLAGDRDLWLVGPDGVARGPLEVAHPEWPVGEVHVAGVETQYDIQQRAPADHGWWMVALAPSPVFAPGPAPSGADILPCDEVFADAADRATCRAALGGAEEIPYVAGDLGCSHSSIQGVAEQLDALSTSADTPLRVEVQTDDDLAGLLAGIDVLQGRRVVLGTGSPEEVAADCQPRVAVASRVRAQTVAWLARREPDALVPKLRKPVVASPPMEQALRDTQPEVEACRVAATERGESLPVRVRVQLWSAPGAAAMPTPPLSPGASPATLACIRGVFTVARFPESAPIAAEWLLSPVGTELTVTTPVRSDDVFYLHHSELVLARRVDPTYPAAAKPLGLGNQRCYVDVAIDALGEVVSLEVTRCPEVFWDGTRRALARWRWNPPNVAEGATVRTTVTVSYGLR